MNSIFQKIKNLFCQPPSTVDESWEKTQKAREKVKKRVVKETLWRIERRIRNDRQKGETFTELNGELYFLFLDAKAAGVAEKAFNAVEMNLEERGYTVYRNDCYFKVFWDSPAKEESK